MFVGHDQDSVLSMASAGHGSHLGPEWFWKVFLGLCKDRVGQIRLNFIQ
jgi:hypothetical protein